MGDINIRLDIIVMLCGAVVSVATAWGVFRKAFFDKIDKNVKDIRDIENRVSDLEKRNMKILDVLNDIQTSQSTYISESRASDRLIMAAMMEIVDNRLTNNNVENLRKTKHDLMNYLKSER